MAIDVQKLAKEILESNQYMTIGSAGKNGTAWVSPVVYAYDNDLNLYFVSHIRSKHCVNIGQNKSVAVAIFDSHQLIGDGVGLQIEGTAKRVTLLEIPEVSLTYFKRTYPYARATKSFNTGLKKLLNENTYRLYKIAPSKIW
ncbi:MAG: Pyridoxamine 5'-phosphate oxidase-related FMN-binding protein, partial [Candidatus Wolfebacteria bacterium GW2011_GWA1_47_6]